MRGPINVSIMSDPAAFAHSASLLRPLPSGIADADVTLAIENHECESANLQIIRDDELVLPTCESLLPGITRGIVKSIARAVGLGVSERNVSIFELYNADEAFICGTVDEIAPVAEIDGRRDPGTVRRPSHEGERSCRFAGRGPFVGTRVPVPTKCANCAIRAFRAFRGNVGDRSPAHAGLHPPPHPPAPAPVPARTHTSACTRFRGLSPVPRPQARIVCATERPTRLGRVSRRHGCNGRRTWLHSMTHDT